MVLIKIILKLTVSRANPAAHQKAQNIPNGTSKKVFAPLWFKPIFFHHFNIPEKSLRTRIHKKTDNVAVGNVITGYNVLPSDTG